MASRNGDGAFDRFLYFQADLHDVPRRRKSGNRKKEASARIPLCDGLPPDHPGILFGSSRMGRYSLEGLGSHRGVSLSRVSSAEFGCSVKGGLSHDTGPRNISHDPFTCSCTGGDIDRLSILCPQDLSAGKNEGAVFFCISAPVP